MNVLVTGATGFVGGRFIEMAEEFLTEDDELILLTSREIEGYKCILHHDYTFSADAFIRAGVERIDKVMHIGHFVSERHEGVPIAKGNLSSINNVMYLLENLPNVPQVFVYCSSMAVYGINREERVDEMSVTCIENPYAASKIMIEMLLNEWAQKNNVLLHILRLAHIYGPRDDRKYSIPIWLQAAQNNQTIKLFVNPKMYRNCLFIDDCCRGMWNALFLEEAVGVINLVSQHNATMQEIADTCRRVSGNAMEVECVTGSVDKTQETGLAFLNNDMCKKYLCEEEWTLEEGLKRELEFFEQCGLLGEGESWIG